MTSISAGDLTKLREQQQYSDIYLSVLQPDNLLVAQVNNAAIARGDRTIAYDTGTGTAAQFARVTAGQTLWIGETAGTYNVGKVRVKSIAGDEITGTITVAENGIDWVDDLHLTIIDFYDIWPIPPRQDAAGVLYKDFDDAYTDENEEPPPVAIMGPHRAGFLVSGTVVFTLDGSASYVIADGAAISSYAWTATGGAIANAAIATTTITFNTAGYYWVTLTVTDDNGKTQLTRRCFWVYDNADTSNQPYRDFTVSSCGGDWNSSGWQFSAEVYGDVALTDFPDGTLAMLWHQNYIDGSADNVNIWDLGDEVICVGYLQRDVDTDDLADSGTGSVSITVNSPTLYISQKTIMATVALDTAADPDEWNQYETWLSVGRAIHHLLRWNSTVIQTCDVIGLTDNTLGLWDVAFNEDSLLDMVNALAFERGIFAKLVSAKDGRLYFVEDSNYLGEADRTALDTIMTITAQDLAGTPQLAREPLEQTSLAFLSGVDYDGVGTGDPYTFLIPGYINTIGYPIPEFWGRGNINKTTQVLANEADGQMKTGRVLAVANNPLRELRLDFRSNYLGAVDIIPSVGWYRWGIANATLKRGLSLLNTDWLCRRVNLRFQAGEQWPGSIQVSAIFEGEAFGEDGITADYPTSFPTVSLPTPNWTPPVTPVGAVNGYFIGGNVGGAVATADKIVYSTAITAAQVTADLSVARWGVEALSDISTYAYWAGGVDAAVNRVATADRLTFATDTTAANAVSDLSIARDGATGLSDGMTYGYWAGGLQTGVGIIAVADRITFSTGVTAANAVSDLAVARQYTGTVSDGTTYGYWAGGTTAFLGLGAPSTLVDRIIFATGVTAAGGFISSARAQISGHSNNNDYGYVIGGNNNAGNDYVTADRLTFSTSAFAAYVTSDLPVVKSQQSSNSGGTGDFGYLGGGSGSVNTYRTNYSTEVTAANAGSNLSTARDNGSGASDGAV